MLRRRIKSSAATLFSHKCRGACLSLIYPAFEALARARRARAHAHTHNEPNEPHSIQRIPQYFKWRVPQMQGMTAGLTKYSCFDCINEEHHLERARVRDLAGAGAWSRDRFTYFSKNLRPLFFLVCFVFLLFGCETWEERFGRLSYYSVCVCETKKKWL